MTRYLHYRFIAAVAAAALIGWLTTGPVSAVGTDDPAKPTSTTTGPADKDSDKKDTDAKDSDKKGTETKPADAKPADKKSHNQFFEGYRQAFNLIYQDHDYVAGIAKLRTLGQDDHPDVANLIGYSSRRLGRYDDARFWYEKALAADPKHVRTWSYYGMWHAEQGNMLKAKEYLEKVRLICGTPDCREYLELKGVMDGTASY
jgi:tetratricopeptide (TPR) repeat protein